MATMDFLIFVFKLTIPIVIAYVGLKLFVAKRNDAIIKKINSITKDAKVNSVKLKLGNLYAMTEDTGNAMKLGKIKGYVLVETKGKPKTQYSMFLIREVTGNMKIYKIKASLHTKLDGDVTLKRWNFENRNNFMVLNETEIIESEEKYNFNVIGVDAIKKISPLVTSGIQLDAIYKKHIRAGMLLKEPEE